MKFYNLLNIFLVVSCTAFAKNTPKSKRDEISDDCKYVNSMVGKDETYNCCEDNRFDCQEGRVTRIEIVGNELVGTVPESIGNLEKLYWLKLNSNNLTTLPESIGKLTELTNLELYNTNLSGALPEFIGKLTNLENLDISSNNFSGPLPDFIGNLTHLDSLNIYGNNFSGPIPECIGKLTELTNLWLGNNNFSGPIPEFLENLTKLKYLGLHENNLSGPIPNIETLANLSTLNLANNSLTGPIPESIENSNIYWIIFSNNCIDCSTVKKSIIEENKEWECEKDNLNEEKCTIKRCGMVNNINYGKCPDDQCCSEKGYCGTNSHFCSPHEGCQAEYGQCVETRCGEGIGKCPDGQCCSEKGYCGTTSKFCFVDQGCQRKYGKCKKIVTIVNKKVVTVTKKVKKN